MKDAVNEVTTLKRDKLTVSIKNILIVHDTLLSDNLDYIIRDDKSDVPDPLSLLANTLPKDMKSIDSYFQTESHYSVNLTIYPMILYENNDRLYQDDSTRQNKKQDSGLIIPKKLKKEADYTDNRDPKDEAELKDKIARCSECGAIVTSELVSKSQINNSVGKKLTEANINLFKTSAKRYF